VVRITTESRALLGQIVAISSKVSRQVFGRSDRTLDLWQAPRHNARILLHFSPDWP
jgi:hypothetical protein